MSAAQNNVADMFASLFQPVEQFPRWYQPTKDIGAILCLTQEDEDELKARDWTPKPLPGSENVIAKITTLESVSDALDVLNSQRALFEQQRKTGMAEMDARMAEMQAMMAQIHGIAPASTASTAAPAAATDTDVPGGLSDASEEVDEPAPEAAPAAPVKASKK